VRILGLLSSLRRRGRGDKSESELPPVSADRACEPAADPEPSEPQVTSGDHFDAEVDAAFESPVFGEAARASGPHDQDVRATRDLFAGIASNQARPVKNFIAELQSGRATKDWIEICRPVMGSIIEAAESMDLSDEARCMVELDQALSSALESEGHQLDGAPRDQIVSAYGELTDLLPETFVLGDDDRRRESILIHALLRQVPDVGHVTFERLYAAGITCLDALFLANETDLAATTGVPESLCARICEKVQEHRHRLEKLQTSDTERKHRERLVKALADLRRLHDEFERYTTAEVSDAGYAAQKREARRARMSCALQLEVVLAELGELDLVEQMQKLAFVRRIEKLEEYLAATAPDSSGARRVDRRSSGVSMER
jgi:hypothetical protein